MSRRSGARMPPMLGRRTVRQRNTRSVPGRRRRAQSRDNAVGRLPEAARPTTAPPSPAYRPGPPPARPVELAPDSADETETVASDPAPAGLVAIGVPRKACAAATTWRPSIARGPALTGPPACRREDRSSWRRRGASLPGRCGKPRKLRPLPKRVRQVAKLLSHPA